MAYRIRKRQRLRAWDYRRPGAYLVTFCTNRRACTLGHIPEPKHPLFDGWHVRLTELGRACEDAIRALDERHEAVRIPAFVVMPNHVHMIIELRADAPSISSVVGALKRKVSLAARRLGRSDAIWQASFHDHIIRDEADLAVRIAYIQDNPRRWHEDELYVAPTCTPSHPTDA